MDLAHGLYSMTTLSLVSLYVGRHGDNIRCHQSQSSYHQDELVLKQPCIYNRYPNIAVRRLKFFNGFTSPFPNP